MPETTDTPSAPGDGGGGHESTAAKQSEILSHLWTPELKREFRDLVDGFFDQHPELRDDSSAALRDYWDSPEGRDVARQMSEAQRS